MDRSQVPNPDDLLERAGGGDEEALGQLLDIYRPYLTLLARLRKNRQLQARVGDSDLVQETAILVHRDFAKFRGASEQEFTAWLRQLMAHVAANLLRDHKRQQRDVRLEKQLHEVFNQSSQMVGRALASTRSTPSQIAARRERAVLLAQALSELPADYREVLVLREMEGMSLRQVAQRMGRTENAVQKLWARAVVQMRRLMHNLLEAS